MFDLIIIIVVVALAGVYLIRRYRRISTRVTTQEGSCGHGCCGGTSSDGAIGRPGRSDSTEIFPIIKER